MQFGKKNDRVGTSFDEAPKTESRVERNLGSAENEVDFPRVFSAGRLRGADQVTTAAFGMARHGAFRPREKMKNTVLRNILALGGLAFALYYVALWLSEPGNRLFSVSFSLIWLAFSAIALAFAFAGDRIVRFARTRVFRKRWVRILTVSVSVSFVAVSLGIFLFICVPSRNDRPQKPEYLLVLGGGIRETGALSSGTRARVDRAAEYARTNPGVIIVATGGKLEREPWPEAREMARYLREEKGIPGASILAEERARDTIQNFAYSAALIAERERAANPERDLLADPPEICVVTTGYHLKRALYLANRGGYAKVSALAAPCPPIAAPSSYLREVGAWWKLWIRILAGGK